MAIKIECSQCGFKNDLGRVFCTQCGQKLDMHRTTMADMSDRREFEFGKLFGRLVGWGLLLGVVSLLGLSLWPVSPAGVLMDPAGFHSVPDKMVAVKNALAARQGVSVNFGEGEVNGYLVARAKSRKLASLTVNFKPGEFDLETRLDWRPPVKDPAWLTRVYVPLNFGMTATFEGERLVVKRAHLGHLPLIGRTLSPVPAFFAGIFNDLMAEKVLVQSLKRALCHEAGIEVGFGK